MPSTDYNHGHNLDRQGAWLLPDSPQHCLSRLRGGHCNVNLPPELIRGDRGSWDTRLTQNQTTAYTAAASERPRGQSRPAKPAPSNPTGALCPLVCAQVPVSISPSSCDGRRDLPLARLSPSTPCEGLQMWALGSQPCTWPLRLQALSVSSPDSQGSVLGPPPQLPTPLTGPPRIPNPKLRSPHAYPVPHRLPIHLHSNCTVGPQFSILRRHQNPVPRP